MESLFLERNPNFIDWIPIALCGYLFPWRGQEVALACGRYRLNPGSTVNGMTQCTLWQALIVPLRFVKCRYMAQVVSCDMFVPFCCDGREAAGLGVDMYVMDRIAAMKIRRSRLKRPSSSLEHML